ncbi:MAG: SPOR domain-containing protein [Prevotella sp.]|jgi:cell division protein FtsN|nr:SPOR domain-containing protein [Prevotella sp.]MBR2202695.1 SPOR domain-containing protein [Prevotella sp.]
MKKTLFVCATLMAAVAFVGCSSSKESAYRKAYEKAKAQEQSQPQYPVAQQAPVVTPLEQPSQQPAYQSSTENVSVRSENVSVISGKGLKAYSVVVGSFGVRSNAEGLQSTLNRAGYDAQVAYNAERNMYRVIVSTFDNKESAIQSRNSIRSTYPDAWLLYRQ